MYTDKVFDSGFGKNSLFFQSKKGKGTEGELSHKLSSAFIKLSQLHSLNHKL